MPREIRWLPKFLTPATFKTQTTPASPPTGFVYVYPKTDGRICLKDETGNEFGLARVATGTLIGGAYSEVIIHNLNTRFIDVNIRNPVAPWDKVITTDEATSLTTATIRAEDLLPAGYTWMVIGW